VPIIVAYVGSWHEALAINDSRFPATFLAVQGVQIRMVVHAAVDHGNSNAEAIEPRIAGRCLAFTVGFCKFKRTGKLYGRAKYEPQPDRPAMSLSAEASTVYNRTIYGIQRFLQRSAFGQGPLQWFSSVAAARYAIITCTVPLVGVSGAIFSFAAKGQSAEQSQRASQTDQ